MEIVLTPLNKVILRYQGLLMKKVSDPYVDLIPLKEGKETEDYHLLWMLQELLHNKDQSETKKHRWLGFIQGVIISKGYTTVLDERIITRDIFNGI